MICSVQSELHLPTHKMMKTAKFPNSQAPKLSHAGLLLGLLALVPTALSPDVFLPMPAIGQISSDGTLSTSVTQNGNNFTINGGDRAGGNLFHSFSEFSVPTGGAALFNNDLDVENIFSRVTGGNISNIDGLIGANGSANLFLLNPAGIIFGPNARLDIGGSFLGSSASSLMFPGGTEFSATDTQSTPLLTINAPIGLWFRGNEGNIVNQSAVNDVGLQVQPGRSLGLVGGNVSLDGGMIAAPGGRVELGGLAALGTVGLNDDGSLSLPDGVARGNVSFANEALVDVRAGEGGSITVNASDLNISGKSRLNAGIGQGLGTPGAQARDITLNATGAITVRDQSEVINRVQTDAIGNAGDIEIIAESLSVSNGARLSASTSGQGNAGNVLIQANGEVSFVSSNIFSSVNSEAVGIGGNIEIAAESIALSEGSQLSASTFGRGDAGSVTLSAIDTVSFDGVSSNGNSSGAFSQVGTEAVGNSGGISITTGSGSFFLTNDARLSASTSGEGNAGNIEIAAESIALSEGSQLSASTFGRGDAGDVTLIASDTVSFDGISSNGVSSGVFTAVQVGAVGNSGDINITTRSLSVTDGAQLSVGTFGEGNSGNVSIKAADIVSFDGEGSDGISSGAASSVEVGGLGNGGSINIATGSLFLTNGAQINASVFGEGRAGSVSIEAANTISFDGEGRDGANSGVFTSIQPGGRGSGGSINITTSSLSVTNGARLSSSTFGQGNAGNLTIEATDTISFDGEGRDGFTSGAFSSVGGEAAGNGSSVNITTNSLSATNGAQLSTSTFGQGNAGDLIIEAADTVFFDGEGSDGAPSGAFSTVQPGGMGEGGSIDIITGSLSVNNGASISTSTFGQGDAGELSIEARQFIVKDGGRVLTATLSDGEAGDLLVRANEVEIIGSRETANGRQSSSTLVSGVFREDATGSGGNIIIETQQLRIGEGATISADTDGVGNAGDVTVNATEVEVFGGIPDSFVRSQLSSQVNDGSTGEGGIVTIETERLIVSNGGLISTGTNSIGNGNDLIVHANEIELVGSRKVSDGSDGQYLSSLIFSGVTGEETTGNGGNIIIETQKLRIAEGAAIAGDTSGIGKAGNVTVNGTEVELFGGRPDGSSSALASQVAEGATGDGGMVTVTTEQLLVRDGGALSTVTNGAGNAGNLIIQANEIELIGARETKDGQQRSSGLFSSINQRSATGEGGNITVETQQLTIGEGAIIAADSFGSGNAGKITVRATEVEVFGGRPDGSSSSGLTSEVEEGATGDGNILTIDTERLLVRDGGQISVSTDGAGDGGELIVIASEIELTGSRENPEGEFVPSGLFSQVGQIDAAGTGGKITIDTQKLLVGEGAVISASTNGIGQAGQVNVNATEIELFGRRPDGSSSGLVSIVSEGATGNGGIVTVKTERLLARDGGGLFSFTNSTGDAGDLMVRANEIELTGLREESDGQRPSGLFSGVNIAEATGSGGEIKVETDSLSLTNGAIVSASTGGKGDAGTIEILADDVIRISGESGIRSTSSEMGDANTLRINTGDLIIRDRGQVSVSSEQAGQAGNLEVNASKISLDNGTLSAETASGTQGNITLNVAENIQLRNNSAINTNATGTATGGNIFINTDFLIAFPGNNDITANAIQGDGGRIEITAEAILGIAQRDELTSGNDITVTSTFGSSGEVIFNIPDVGALQGTENLSENAVEAEEAVTQACGTDSSDESSFTVIGRGGVPRGPQDPLVSDTMRVGGELSSQTAPTKPPIPIVTLVEDTEPISPEDIVLARGWIVNEDGVVELTAYPTPYTSDRPFPTPVRCPRKK